MELKDVLLTRRSVRRFTNESVSDEMIKELLIAAMSGPSACNRVPWEFYVVTNKEKLEGLKHVTQFTNYDAPLAIIVCGNLSRSLPRELAEYWVQDCSAATQNILLRATDMGLGAVWCGLHPQKKGIERTRELLELPDDNVPLNVIYIGHSMEIPEARTQYDEKYIHFI